MERHEIFKEATQAVFGYGYQTKIANEYGFDVRQVRRWIKGEAPIREYIYKDVLKRKRLTKDLKSV